MSLEKDASKSPSAKPNNNGKIVAEIAIKDRQAISNQPGLSPEQLDALFVSECDKYLIEMNVAQKPTPFTFPYIDLEEGGVKFAKGLMEEEKITIAGHQYSIDAPGNIVLTKITFPGGYNGETQMDGNIDMGLFAIPSPVATTVKTSDLYQFLDALRQGLAKGTIKKLPTSYGDVEFKAL